MHLIIEEAYITIKGFLKHLSITLNIYFVRNMTLIFFSKGIPIITVLYIHIRLQLSFGFHYEHGKCH